MRFEQLKRQANVVLHKKLRKSGKVWLVVGTLFFTGGLAIENNMVAVKADVTSEAEGTASNDERGSASSSEQSGDQAAGNPEADASEANDNSAKQDDDPTTPSDTQTNEYFGGSNETIDDSGNVTADIQYQNQTYSVKGQVGTIAPAQNSAGDKIYVNINKQSSGKLPDDTRIELAGPAGFSYNTYDKYGNKMSNGRNGDSVLNVDQSMKDSNGDLYYHLVDEDTWVKQANGVDGGSTNDGSNDYMVYNVVPKDYPYNDANSVTNKILPAADNDGIISGQISVKSINYGRDFTYDYKGKAGETVSASMNGDSEKDFPYAPVVKIKLLSTTIGELPAGATIELAGPAGFVYSLYDKDMSLSDRGLNGGSAWGTDKKMTTESATYYRVSTDEWIKQVSGVIPSDENVDNPKTEYSIDPDIIEPVLADVTVTSNLADQVVTKQHGAIGSTIDVAVPVVKGYTADKQTIQATVNPDRTITPLESVEYTKDESTDDNSNSNGGNHHSNSNHGSHNNVKKINYDYLNQTIATYLDRGPVQLFAISNNKFNPVSERALKPGTSWVTDQMATITGKHYYRVSTNEWVEAKDAYVYEEVSKVLNIEKITPLINDEEKISSSRELGSDTAWKTDRIVYLGDYQNPTVAYRVSTDEFVIKNN